MDNYNEQVNGIEIDVEVINDDDVDSGLVGS